MPPRSAGGPSRPDGPQIGSASRQIDIEHIARGVIGRTLPKREWTHAAHFAAALWLLRGWLTDRPGALLCTALAELLASPYGRSDWPLAYWSRERLFSAAARRTWTEPDLRPFTC